MSQKHADAVGSAVGWANKRLCALGVEDTVAMVYTGGAARLLTRDGVEKASHPHADPYVACGVVLLEFENGLRALLRDGGKP